MSTQAARSSQAAQGTQGVKATQTPRAQSGSASPATRTATYVWEGVNKQGKKVKGESQAQGEAHLKAELRRKGINPLKVKKKSKPLLSR
nr:hypothetical protein [Gammaproteobacteria bacterium]